MVFLKNSQNSLENAFATRHIKNGISLDFIKKDTLRRCFPVNFANFLRSFFFKTPPVVASGKSRQRTY